MNVIGDENWKILFHCLYPPGTPFPTLSEVINRLQPLFMHPDLSHLVYSLLNYTSGVPVPSFVDQNVFHAICTFVKQPTFDPAALQPVYTIQCTRCHKLKPSYHFLVPDGFKLSLRCYRCRTSSSKRSSPDCARSTTLSLDPEEHPGQIPAFIYTRVIDEKSPSFHYAFHQWHLYNHQAAQFLSVRLYTCYTFRARTLPTDTPTKAQRDMTERQILASMTTIDNFRYCRRGTLCYSTYYRCAQRFSHKCDGSLNISYSHSPYCTITFNHALHPPRDDDQEPLSTSLQARTAALTQNGFTPTAIQVALHDDYQIPISITTVFQSFTSTILQAANTNCSSPFSTFNYVSELPNLHPIFHSVAPPSFAFTTTFARRLTKELQIAEVAMDSISIPCQSPFTIYTVLASVLGVGFPIAFLFTFPIPSTQKPPNHATHQDHATAYTLNHFLKALYTELPSLRPIFFLTHDIPPQLTAIRKAFRLEPLLCRRHVHQLITQYLQSLRDEEIVNVPNKVESELHAFMKQQRNSHVFLTLNRRDWDASRMRDGAIRQVRRLLCEVEDESVLNHILETWYATPRFLMWGRRRAGHIAINNDVTELQSRWSDFKRMAVTLLPGQPSEVALHLLACHILPHAQNDFRALFHGNIRPHWWPRFEREWQERLKDMGKNGIDDRFTPQFVDHEKWLCVCKKFTRSDFLLCEHLINGANAPAYELLHRRRTAPYIQVDKEYGLRPFAIVGKELMGIAGEMDGILRRVYTEYTEVEEETEDGDDIGFSSVPPVPTKVTPCLSDELQYTIGEIRHQLDTLERQLPTKGSCTSVPMTSAATANLRAAAYTTAWMEEQLSMLMGGLHTSDNCRTNRSGGKRNNNSTEKTQRTNLGTRDTTRSRNIRDNIRKNGGKCHVKQCTGGEGQHSVADGHVLLESFGCGRKTEGECGTEEGRSCTQSVRGKGERERETGTKEKGKVCKFLREFVKNDGDRGGNASGRGGGEGGSEGEAVTKVVQGIGG